METGSVLRPLNALDVNPLLHHLPEWAHLPQLVHMIHSHSDGTVHFLLCGEAPQPISAAQAALKHNGFIICDRRQREPSGCVSDL